MKCVRCNDPATHLVERTENHETIATCDHCTLEVATEAGDRFWAVRVTTLYHAA